MGPRKLARERLREPGDHVGTHSAGSASSRWCWAAFIAANCRRGAHDVGSQQVPSDTAPSALTSLAFIMKTLPAALSGLR
jgi:hypothetical protein